MMRSARLGLILCALCSIGAGADTIARLPVAPPPPRAQACAAWPDRATRQWTGQWSDRQGWRYTFELGLRRNGASVTGQYVWRLAESPDATMRGRLGHTAVERVQGTVDCASGALVYAGYQVSDDTLIAADSYRVQIGAALALSGQSRGNEGLWDGVLSARRR
jgi:hypothetical protein